MLTKKLLEGLSTEEARSIRLRFLASLSPPSENGSKVNEDGAFDAGVPDGWAVFGGPGDAGESIGITSAVTLLQSSTASALSRSISLLLLLSSISKENSRIDNKNNNSNSNSNSNSNNENNNNNSNNNNGIFNDEYWLIKAEMCRGNFGSEPTNEATNPIGSLLRYLSLDGYYNNSNNNNNNNNNNNSYNSNNSDSDEIDSSSNNNTSNGNNNDFGADSTGGYPVGFVGGTSRRAFAGGVNGNGGNVSGSGANSASYIDDIDISSPLSLILHRSFSSCVDLLSNSNAKSDHFRVSSDSQSIIVSGKKNLNNTSNNYNNNNNNNNNNNKDDSLDMNAENEGEFVVGVSDIEALIALVESERRGSIETRKKLEKEFASSKSAAAKDPVRISQRKLGSHCESRGDMEMARKWFIRSRDYCTTSSHVTEMCIDVVRLSMAIGDYSTVIAYASKAEQTAESAANPAIKAALNAAVAFSVLRAQSAHNFVRKAAVRIVAVTTDIDDIALDMPLVGSARDCAVVGALAAVDSFSREEIKTKMIDSVGFRHVLDTCPVARGLVHAFYNADYRKVALALREIEPLIRTHLWAHQSSSALLTRVLERVLHQLFLPYRTLPLSHLRTHLLLPLSEGEPFLRALIAAGLLPGRIDAVRGIYSHIADNNNNNNNNNNNRDIINNNRNDKNVNDDDVDVFSANSPGGVGDGRFNRASAVEEAAGGARRVVVSARAAMIRANVIRLGLETGAMDFQNQGIMRI